MKKVVIYAILILNFSVGLEGFAQKKEFIEEYTYTAGDRDSKDDCYDIAKSRLQTILLDRIGVYVRTETSLKTTDYNGKYSQKFDENISILSAAVTEFRVLDQKWDGVKYWMKAMITIDTTTLERIVSNIMKTSEIDELKVEIAKMKAEIELVKVNRFARPEKSSNKLYALQIVRAKRDEQYLSLVYSQKNKLLFITSSKGQLLSLNEHDSIKATLKYKHSGIVSLDHNGEIGAYTDVHNTIHFFNQTTLKPLDSVQVNDNGSVRVWFTKTTIFFSTEKTIYKYTLNHKVVPVLASYSILDYDLNSDQFLLGKWESSVKSDRKIKNVYIADATNLTGMEHVLTVDRSFELYSFLMEDASLVMSYDGRGNYYKVNTYTKEKKITVQDTIKNQASKVFGLSKVNNNTILVVKHNAIPLTTENIDKYNLTLEDSPTEFLFKRPSTNEVVRSILLMQPVTNNQIVISDATKTIYYLTSGGNGNKLISIK